MVVQARRGRRFQSSVSRSLGTQHPVQQGVAHSVEDEADLLPAIKDDAQFSSSHPTDIVSWLLNVNRVLNSHRKLPQVDNLFGTASNDIWESWSTANLILSSSPFDTSPPTIINPSLESSPSPPILSESQNSPTSPLSIVVPAVPTEVLDTIVHSAVYGDEECQTIVLKLQQEISSLRSSASWFRWAKHERRTIRKAHLVLLLEAAVEAKSLTYAVSDTV